jgi:hypothetical protein
MQLVPLRNQVSVRVELEACEVWSVQGQRGTCVTSRHPPPNRVVIFFLRGGFLITPDSAGSMAQRDNRLPFWVPDCTPPYSGPPGRCRVHPGTPRGQTK